MLVDLYRVDAPGAARLAAELLDQGRRGALRLRAHGRRRRRERVASSPSRSGSRRGEDSLLEGIRAYNEEDCRSLYELHRWLLEQRPPELAVARCRPRSASVERGDAGAARRARRASATSSSRARRRASRAGCSRSCSSTTAARRSRSGGSTSTTATLDEEELLEDRDTIGGLELDGEPVQDEAVARVHVHASRRRSTRSAATARRSGDRAARTTSRSTTSTARVTLRRGAKRARRAAADGADPAGAAPTLGAARRGPPLRRGRGRVPGARRDPRAAAAAGAARRDARRRGAQPRRQLPLRAGPARLGQDVDRRAAWRSR